VIWQKLLENQSFFYGYYKTGKSKGKFSRFLGHGATRETISPRQLLKAKQQFVTTEAGTPPECDRATRAAHPRFSQANTIG
jgi:hypothetical protein